MDANGPVADAAFVSAELIEVHVPGADQLAVAILEKQAFGPPGLSSCGRGCFRCHQSRVASRRLASSGAVNPDAGSAQPF
jgi:hypothetical protein